MISPHAPLRLIAYAALLACCFAGDGRCDEPKTDSKETKTAPDNAAAPVTDVDKLSFDQSKAAAEMAELEQRMFRLGEGLSKLEPENSSRLRMALKYAREELILLKMKQSQDLLDKRSFADASNEQKQTLSKLQRLEELLLAKDLDFQMKLERLRKLKEILRQLDAAIQDEDRQVQQTKVPAKEEEQLQRLRKRQESLEALIAQQSKHVEDGKRLAVGEASGSASGGGKGLAKTGEGNSKAGRGGDGASGKSGNPGGAANKDKAAGAPKRDVENRQDDGLKQLVKRQADTRTQTNRLVADANSSSANLQKAEGEMSGAVAALEGKSAEKAVPKQQSALDELKKELEAAASQSAALEKKLAEAKFPTLKKDEQRNRKLTEDIAQNVRQLGQNGTSALEELQRATGSQANAESSLESRKPGPASESQQAALQSLRYAREQLAQEKQKLLEELQPEVHAKALANLNLMLEMQTAVRETTEKLAAKWPGGGQAVLAAQISSSKEEAKIIGLADATIEMTEETEFSLALPDALKVVRETMVLVRDRLEMGDGSPVVVDFEKRIEQDLRDLIAAMKQMPSSRKPSKPKPPGQDPSEQEKELNRLIAELRMIRLMQLRVNSDTTHTDKTRPPPPVPGPVKELIGRIERLQVKVRDTTAKLSEQRERPPADQ